MCTGRNWEIILKISLERFLPSNQMYQYFKFEEFAAKTEEEGYKSIDLYVAPPHFWVNERETGNTEEIIEILKKYNLSAEMLTADYVTNRYMLNAAENSRRESSFRYYKNCLCVAEKLGAKLLAVSLGGAFRDENMEPAFDRACAMIQALCSEGEKKNIAVCAEPICRCEGPLFCSLDEMKKLSSRVQSPFFRIGIDLVQLNDSGEDVKQWMDEFKEQIGIVRFSDARVGKSHLLPGEGILPMEEMLEEFKDYTGMFSLKMTKADYYQDPFKAECEAGRALQRILIRGGAE